ncbi:MAG: GerW family sporulation protein [Oscillospiraceae bacterium]|jgi:sporulation protein YtfJ|uniref:GerW family sporulation protein n=1 Tax=Candidatus Pseudoscillospira sp. SGI.172 TaxID=3420582 RepID=UPI002A79F223|nr:GerW family sporulation protein [Pseudoflavonifractor sp.]MDY3018989.1 GerW family sporulation protein [Oscillospiraceae bacterium]
MEKKEHPLNDLMSATMEKIRAMVDVNAVVGQPIQTGEVTIIPVSKVSFGFASGGSDFAGKNQKPEAENSFGGGSGAGVNINPIAFLVVRGDNVRLLYVAPPIDGAVDRVVDMVPELVDKVTGFIEKQQEKKDNADF